MNNRSIRINAAATLPPSPAGVGASLERVCAAVERLRAGGVVAIFAPDSRSGSVHLVVSADLVDARALQLLVRLERGPLRLAVAERDEIAAGAVELVRMTGSMAGALSCEIDERVIAPLRVHAFEDWADAFNVPVVSCLDIDVARSTLADLRAARPIAANAP